MKAKPNQWLLCGALWLLLASALPAHAFYNPSTGRWLSRDPIAESGGVNLHAFNMNDSVSKVDYLGHTSLDLALKMAGKQVPKAFGLNANGSIVLKVPWLPGLVAGGGNAVTFFPDTCQIASYWVRAGLGNALAEWRPPTKQEYDTWNDYGLNAGFGLGIELAYYIGNTTPGSANPDSFTGLFHTATVGFVVPVGGVPIPVGVGAYRGDRDASGGTWYGGSLAVGPSWPSVSLAVIDWNYQYFAGPVKLPKCLCYAAILAMP